MWSGGAPNTNFGGTIGVPRTPNPYTRPGGNWGIGSVNPVPSVPHRNMFGGDYTRRTTYTGGGSRYSGTRAIVPHTGHRGPGYTGSRAIVPYSGSPIVPYQVSANRAAGAAGAAARGAAGAGEAWWERNTKFLSNRFNIGKHNTSIGRAAVVGGLGLLSLRNTANVMDRMRYGDYGGAMMSAAMAGAAGYGAYRAALYKGSMRSFLTSTISKGLGAFR